jgi:O-methyltransferase
VQDAVGHDDLVSYYKGWIPHAFEGLVESAIALAHVDVDIHRSVRDCCEFIFPRLSSGGFMVFDDYGFPCCPGARAAVDAYFAGTGLQPLVLPTGQAIVFKSIARS